MKRNYPTLVPRSIHLNQLRRFLLSRANLPVPSITVSIKLPLDMEGTYHNVPVYPYWGENKPMGHFTIVVNKSVPSKDICRWTNKVKKSSKHRIFIKWQDKLIPAGRAAQAKI